MRGWRRPVIKPWGIAAGVLGVSAAAVALWVFSRQELPQRVWASNSEMGQPVIGYGGRPLTVGRIQPVLLVMPRRLSSTDRRLVARAMKLRSLGPEPVLWQAPARAWAHWHATTGIRVVHARVDGPVAGLAASVLANYMRGVGVQSKVSWGLHGLTYQPLGLRAVRVTINPGLETALARDVKGAQSMLVVAQGGRIRATAGDWTRAYRVGTSAIPPLMAEALTQGSVKSALGHGPTTLSALSRVWGSRASWLSAQKLGLVKPAVDRSGFIARESLLNGSASLKVTSEQLAQSYVAFVNQGQLTSLTLNARVLPHSRRADGAFPTVLSELPTVDENSVLFKVWRPVGHFTVILAPTLHELAVLQGVGESDMVAVMKAMATTKD